MNKLFNFSKASELLKWRKDCLMDVIKDYKPSTYRYNYWGNRIKELDWLISKFESMEKLELMESGYKVKKEL